MKLDLFIKGQVPAEKGKSLGDLLDKWDGAIAVVVALLVGLATWGLASAMPTSVIDGINNPDVYFSADCSRVHDNMVSRLESNHHRTNVHPLFSLIMNPAFQAVAFVTGNSPEDEPLSSDAIATTRIVSGLAGAITIAVFYLLLRVLECRRLDSLLLCLLFCSSAFAIYWYAVPETYPWGTISILLALLVSAVGSRLLINPLWYLLTSLGTFSITTTNWSVGLLSKLTRYGWKRAAIYSGVVLFVACVLALLQRQLVPSSWYFFRIEHESNYVNQDTSGGPLNCIKSALYHSMIAPEVKLIPHSREEGKQMMQMQTSSAGSKTLAGRLAIPVWTALFVGGLFALVREKRFTPFRATLGISLLGQFVLHSVYGAETFLYSAHYGPLMITPLAFLVQTKYRLIGLAGIAILIVLIAINNAVSFSAVVDYLETLPTRSTIASG